MAKWDLGKLCGSKVRGSDDRVDIHYVLDAVEDLLRYEDMNQVREYLEEWHDEMIHNLGVNQRARSKGHEN